MTDPAQTDSGPIAEQMKEHIRQAEAFARPVSSEESDRSGAALRMVIAHGAGAIAKALYSVALGVRSKP